MSLLHIPVAVSIEEPPLFLCNSNNPRNNEKKSPITRCIRVFRTFRRFRTTAKLSS